MLLLDRMREARQSYSVKQKEFIHIFTKNPNATFCFFEGEDVKYYGPRINLLCPELEWVGLDCGGKSAVLKLFSIISEHEVYARAKVFYFVDKDFDDNHELTDIPNIYVTPCYSVENLYVTDTTFKRILTSEFGINEISDDDGAFAKCVKLFTERLIDFVDSMEMMNAWILFHRRIEEQGGDELRINLHNLKIGNFVNVDLVSTHRKYSLDDLNAIENSRKVSSEDIVKMAGCFDKTRRHLDFRGKFQAYFMRYFLTNLVADSKSNPPTYLSKHRHISLSISERNFLSDLCQYADTPACLRSFLFALR